MVRCVCFLTEGGGRRRRRRSDDDDDDEEEGEDVSKAKNSYE